MTGDGLAPFGAVGLRLLRFRGKPHNSIFVSLFILMTACAPQAVPVAPRAPASLLVGCTDPDLVSDPQNATNEQINVERVTVAKAYADCKRRDADKAAWIKGLQ